MQKIVAGIGAVAAASLLLFLFLRPGPEGAPKKSTPHTNSSPSQQSWSKTKAKPKIAKSTSPKESDPARLKPFLARLGRALLLNDTKGTDEIARSAPVVYETDIPWLLARLQDKELVTIAGAAWTCVIFEVPGCIPELGAALQKATHLALKRVLITALYKLDGRTELLTALTSERDAAVRALILQVLGPFAKEDEAAYQALLLALQADPDSRVRIAAARWLGSVDRALADFLRILELETDPSMQAALAEAAYERAGDPLLSSLQPLRASNPSLSEKIRQVSKRNSDARYNTNYAPEFFKDGGTPVQVGAYRRLGITVDTRESPTVKLVDVARELFAHAPLDRYRDTFYFRMADEFEIDAQQGVPSARAYDSQGNAVPEGIPANDLDGVVFVRYVDPSKLKPGTLGYTEGNEANVTQVSLLHEVGHALAQLGDEYSNAIASQDAAVNLELREKPPAWHSLIDQGHLPQGPFLRVEPDDSGRDIGKYQVPSDSCFMNNAAKDRRYCPVCQLQVIARICAVSGAPVPW